MDQYLRFVNGIQALRRKTAALGIGLGGALGVAANPLPHQLATVRRILSDSHIRHLISDEVGLGKAIQALMIVNALRWQDPTHRALIIAPDNLLSQWQEECWIRGHVMPSIAGTIGEDEAEHSPVTLARPRDLITRPGQEGRTISADPAVFDLLIVDEPQTMSRDALQSILPMSDDFRQVLVLSATPRLGDPVWREIILRMIEPGAATLARIEGRSLDEVLKEREERAIATRNPSDSPKVRAQGFLRSGAGRRVIRNGRADWGAYLPQRRNHEIRVQPLTFERMRHEIAAKILEGADPEQGLQGASWTSARALQRSARAARAVLMDLAASDGTFGRLAERARIKSLEDPGDSRLEALLDILSEQWSQDDKRAFIIVCGDNPTIDMLQAALPRYFPVLKDGISELRRPATTDVEGVTNLREIQETLAPLLSGNSRLLLVGDWVQAGLNLHHVAQGIIFFSLPWEIDSIDQLIGRVDRLGAAADRKGSKRIIDIWRILIEGSQETAIADTVASLGVFDAPLPPLSPAEMAKLQTTLGHAAIRRKTAGSIASLKNQGASLQSLLTADDPFTPQQSAIDFKRWHELPSPPPAMMTGLALSKDSPIRKEERAIGAWLKTISFSKDFDVRSRRDNADGYWFKTMWYRGASKYGQADNFPFLLPVASLENWMTGHVPFIYRRSDITAPPRKGVFTDAGERSKDDAPSARPLRFLDHGGELHDKLVRGYSTAALAAFGASKPVQQTSVRLPDGHPARGIGPLVFIATAHIDPFPDNALPPLWGPAATEILEAAPTEAQKKALSADRKALQCLFRAMQRKVRIVAPAEMVRVGAWRSKDGWKELTSEEVDLCLQPIAPSTDNAMARGRTPPLALEKREVVNAVRRRQFAKIDSEIKRFRAMAKRHLSTELESLSVQLFAHFEDEIRNRELTLERRRQSPPDSGPIELWQGQVAALERSLTMARLNFSEAITFLQEMGSGNAIAPSVQSCSILLNLFTEE